VKGSISDLADLDRLYAAVKAERGTLDIVFANAGAGSPLPLGKITAEQIDETFDTTCRTACRQSVCLSGSSAYRLMPACATGTSRKHFPLHQRP
jgi:NAD(P)-dependent dehydrogenase (short-subunit alcohol dehydrogenase family)